MKKLFVFVCLCGLCYSSQAQSVTKTLVAMDKLQRDGKHLEAMDSATVVLLRDKDNNTAKNFIYKHWDKTIRKAEAQLTSHANENNLEDAKVRLTIYRLLDEIHSNLGIVGMPLYGPNKKWVWQPELGYYAGMYTTERMKTYKMAMQKANEALDSYDVASAQEYYAFALEELCPTPNAEKRCKNEILQAVNSRLDRYAQSQELHRLLAHYNLLDLALWVDNTQTEKAQQQSDLQPIIAEHYRLLAEKYAAEGDSIRAAENQQLAEDWK